MAVRVDRTTLDDHQGQSKMMQENRRHNALWDTKLHTHVKSRPRLRFNRKAAFTLVMASALASLLLAATCLEKQTIQDILDPHAKTAYVWSERIFISGNSEFHDAADAKGWPGDGTEISPYLIENLEIQAITTEQAISISDTDVFFEINSCNLWNESETGFIGIALWRVSNATLSDNLITSSSGIALIECSNITISSNRCLDGTEVAIGVEDSSCISLSENLCRGYHNAVGVSSSNNITLVDNRIVFNSGNGLGISGVAYSIFEGNEISDNSGNGIRASGLFSTVVSSNDLCRNGEQGLHIISDGHFNDISNNTFADNTLEGLKIQCSTGTRIHNNTFIDNNGAGENYDENHVQAFDAWCSNFWNSSTHGNYWSDWQIPDGNSDGIVDEPYQTGPFDDPENPDYGATDYLPLTSMPTTPIPEFHSIAFTVVGLTLMVAALVRIKRRRS